MILDKLMNKHMQTHLTDFFPDTLGKPAPRTKKRRWDSSGIMWTICKSFAPWCRQITMPAFHHASTSSLDFLHLDAPTDAQPTVSKHRTQLTNKNSLGLKEQQFTAHSSWRVNSSADTCPPVLVLRCRTGAQTMSVDLQNDPENDRMISDHILCMHRYRSPGEQDGEGMIIFCWKGYF